MSDMKTLTGDSRRDTINDAEALGSVTWIKALWVRWRALQERRAAIAALANLDDRMLKDMGIERSQIATIVNQGARRGRPRR